jgi:hypothetical protein
MSKDEQMSVAQVLEMPPGDESTPAWVNNLVGRVQSVTKKQTRGGKDYWPCVIEDTTQAHLTVAMTVWTAPRFKIGDTIEVGGSGNRLTQYDGDLQIALSKKSEVHVITAGANRPAAAPPADNSGKPKDDTRGGAPAERAPHPVINGQTVGMAVKAAVDILIHNANFGRLVQSKDGVHLEAIPVELTELRKDIKTVAAEIIAAARDLETGAVPPAGEEVSF